MYNMDSIEIYKNILNGKLSRFPKNFWQQSGVEHESALITKYFIENVLSWDENDIREKTSEMIFRKHKLSGMLEFVFDRSPCKAILNAYPNKYKAWELPCVPRGFWENENNRNEALRWLLQKCGKCRFDELSNKDFLNFKLGGLMTYLSVNSLSHQIDIGKVEDGIELGTLVKEFYFGIKNTGSARNKVLAQIDIPISMLNSIGVSEHNRKVQISVINGSIIIKPAK